MLNLKIRKLLWPCDVYGLPRWCSGKESACECRRCRRRDFNPWVGKIPKSRKWQPDPYLENSMDRGAWQGSSPKGHKESDTTEQAIQQQQHMMCNDTSL